MENYGKLWKITILNGKIWKTMEKHHFEWKTMENYGKIHHFLAGKINYFDWAMFNSYVSLPEGIGPKNGWR